ncbi:MAG: diguanylate cyclase, partial [Candidatus Zixiibacteriota bacterium]
MLRKILHKPITVVIISAVLVFLLVNGLRNGGYLEFLELSAYDWFIRLTPKQTSESPWITIIAISEEDIQSIGHWPLSDKTIAEALTTILDRNPRAIGLDIYRDIPVPPGREELNHVFADNS